MSIRPIAFNPDGSIDVVFDELGHSGTIPASDIAWTTNTLGDKDHNYINLICPDGCGLGTSTHPVGGGSSPAMVQEMFVRKIDREGCVCPTARDIKTSKDAIDHVKELVTAMDGEDRWQVNEAELLGKLRGN